MHRILTAVVISLIVPLTSLCAQDAEEGFVPLFNGKDFSGWQRVNTDERTWSIDSGVLHCSGKPIGQLRTTRMYQNFIMEVEWRHMVPKGNSGIFVWADDITAKGQPFQRGIEVQVLENAYGTGDWFTTHGDIFPIHGAAMKPINGRGGSRAFPTEERSKPTPQWNHYRIEANDGAISLAVNGKVVTQGVECNPRKGYLCLESEGGVVEFRNIKIKELPETPIDDDMVAVADRGYRCLYTGIDLAGWDARGSENWNARDWILSYAGSGSDMERLTTAESFGDYGFVVDVRLNKDSGSPEIRLRGDAAAITIGEADGEISQHLDKLGKWNRIEGEVRGDQVALSVNGKPIKPFSATGGSDAKGPLTLIPDGPVDFANIYVR